MHILVMCKRVAAIGAQSRARAPKRCFPPSLKLDSDNDFTLPPRQQHHHNHITATMLSRTLRAAPRRLPALRSAYSTTPDNPIPANDPKGRHPRSPVSATNATPTSSEGSQDKVLQESVEQGEELRTMQSPNRKDIWSRSQQPRERAMVGPRFEQTIMADQVCGGIKDENTGRTFRETFGEQKRLDIG
jgi:hypothetical protein